MMAFEDYTQKDTVVVVYTGEGKGKTSASIGLLARALGRNWKVAYIQFIKHWKVGEHDFINAIQDVYNDKLYFYKGGKGFFNAGDLSAKNVEEKEHKDAAQLTLKEALKCATSGEYDLVICDEINNAVHDGLLEVKDQLKLLSTRSKKTSLCFTGRNFAEELIPMADIVTNMSKVKHHFDDKYLANEGIDY
jgi:cob(I)alamin adenosyltransferase